jgi:hypothetical protein
VKAEAEAKKKKKKKERIEKKIKGVSYKGVKVLFFLCKPQNVEDFERFIVPVLFLTNILKATDHLIVVPQ